MQKIYLTIGSFIFSSSLMGMKFHKSQNKIDPALDQEILIRNFLQHKTEKETEETEALKQEFMIRQLLNHKTKEEALAFKNQNSSECAFFCKIV